MQWILERLQSWPPSRKEANVIALFTATCYRENQRRSPWMNHNMRRGNQDNARKLHTATVTVNRDPVSSISNERSAFLSTSTWWWQDFPFFVSTVLMCLLQSPLRKFNSNYYARVVISELMLNDAKPNLFDFPLPTFHAPPRLWNVLLEDFVLVILFWQVMNKTHRAVQFERWKRFHS